MSYIASLSFQYGVAGSLMLAKYTCSLCRVYSNVDAEIERDAL